MTPANKAATVNSGAAESNGQVRTKTRKVMVTIGTDHHPFHRLITWFDEWAASVDTFQIDAVVQRGQTPAGTMPSVEYLGFNELVAALSEADIVVTHGGPGSIVECRRSGKLPLVVARDPQLGEHVDNHQQLFCERMAAAGQILLARDQTEFSTLMDQLAEHPQMLPPQSQEHVDATVRRIGQIVDRLVAGRMR